MSPSGSPARSSGFIRKGGEGAEQLQGAGGFGAEDPHGATLLLATAFGGVAGPGGPGALGGYLIAVMLAAVISIQLLVLLDMTSFWTLEVTGIYLSYSLVSRLLSGSLVPLWFMPDWLRVLAGVLPFQATTFTPVAIYLGSLDGAAMWRSLGISAAWVIILALLLRWSWARVVNRVVVQGG
ncbi:MAG TPA: ABC-2 family transporter protein [Microlunatus sp.]|jgi:ABC-type uncharacterized transport system permease subunit|nr:ABC-2 family transporter protein [Microlunatus sp.]